MSEVLNGWTAFERALIFQRYSIRDPKTSERLEKTYEDVIDRIANFLLTQKFPVSKEILRTSLEMARSRKFTFATPVLMNLGNPFTERVGFYSCYPLGPIPDSTEEILKYVQACASVFQYAGGVGLDFSSLRPKGSGVDRNQGESSGPVGFIPMFESTSKSIAAGGKRRGAMLGQLDYDHQDIFSYVRLKRDRRDLWSINISVNAFGDFWEQKELIHEIAVSIWTSGDPGLLFPDILSKLSPYPSDLKPQLRYVNPCVTGDTKVATELGEIPVAELAERFQRGEKIRVLNSNGNYTIPLRVWRTRENAKVVLVKLSDGHELKVTPDHKFYVISEHEFSTLRREWMERGHVDLSKVSLAKKRASELTSSDCLVPESYVRVVQDLPSIASYTVRTSWKKAAQVRHGEQPINVPDGLGVRDFEFLGYLVGDGCLTDSYVELVAGGSENFRGLVTYFQPVLEKFGVTFQEVEKNPNSVEFTGGLRCNRRPFLRFLRALGVSLERSPLKSVPSFVFEAPASLRAAFLRGYFTADGTIYVDKHGTFLVRFSTSSRQLVQDIQLLLDSLGIRSYLTFTAEEGFFSKDYVTKSGKVRKYKSASNLIVQVDVFSLRVFCEFVGFCDFSLKSVISKKLLDSFSPKFRGTGCNAVCRVESVEELNEHYDVYNITEPETHKVFYNGVLTSNCGEYASPPFSVCHLLTGNALSAKKVEDFEVLGYYMTHVGNAILWLTLQTGKGVPQKPLWLRRRFLEKVKQIHPVGVGLTGVAEYLYREGLEYSNVDHIRAIYSALARGSLLASSEWAASTKEEKEWDPEYKEEHLRTIEYKGKTRFWNTTTLSQAPTGSVSQFLRCISTGLEPFESFKVQRQFLNDKNEFQTVILSSQVKPDPSRKLSFISPEDQIRVVSTVQMISHTSASKTINVPKETTVEEIEEIIYSARKYQLKGLTIYRRGCALDSVVDTVETKERDEDVLYGVTYKFKGLNSIYITVNHEESGKPVEVFVSTGKSGNVVNGLAMGLGRLVSLALRSGTKPEVIMKSLSGIETGDYYVNKKIGRVSSICDAVAKVIQDILTSSKVDSVLKEEFDLCPKCQSFTLIRNGQGCKSCTKCGYATC